MYIDAHCHLEEETYGAELPEVIARAHAAGLQQFIAVGASGVTAGARQVVALAERLPEVFASVGVHPHEAQQAHDDPSHFNVIETLLGHPKVVCLGEVGLDYFYKHSDPQVQRQVFRRFLKMAKEHNKPIMLHIRDAHADAWEALDEVGLGPRGGVVHCFTGGPEEAREYLQRGMYLSIPGVVTFKSAENLRDAVRQAPLDRLFLETDCPYLAPVPHRGKRNEPAFLVKTAEAVAGLLHLPTAEVGRQTTANAQLFFNLPN